MNFLPLSELEPYERNARRHPPKHVAQLVVSIQKFGWTQPVLVDGRKIVAGHGRCLAARSIYAAGDAIALPSGVRIPDGSVPAIDCAGWTSEQRRAYILADNQIALLSTWDDDLLAAETADLQSLGFDLTVAGFSESDLVAIKGKTDPDEAPPVSAAAVTRAGDVWLLGGHRLLCGDSTVAESYGRVLDGEPVDMVFTDPPYNVNYANSAKDKMRGKDRPILNDDLGEGFFDFLLAAFTPMIKHCRGGVYVAMPSSELDTLQSAFRAAGGRWSTFIIWAKNTFTLGRADYQRQYEPILYGWPDGAKRHWCGDRDQGDVWNIKKPQKNDLHPTMKPVELVERAIRNSSRPGNVVLDPFGGSGTTLIAAETSGRLARLIELDPKYADVIVRRWQAFTGQAATHEGDGRTFDVLTLERGDACGTARATAEAA